MKKFLAVFLSLLFILTSLPVSASDYPGEFWPLNEQYALALDSGDDAGIIDYGSQIILLYDGKEFPVALDILASRAYEVANAYERLGNYAMAKAYYDYCVSAHRKIMENCLADPDADKLKYEASAAVVLTAEHKSALYTDVLDLYMRTDKTQYYYCAVNEPEFGVRFGVPINSSAYYKMDNESMVLIYQKFGEILGANEHSLRNAVKNGTPIEFTLNLAGEGSELKSVLKKRSYIREILDALDATGLPVYLRFAAEMNVWTTPADPEDYIEAFRFVADIVHKDYPNIAMVWSPNVLSAWGVDVDAFYPGDEYVDWVGVSLYMIKYFQGIEDWSADPNTPIFFCAGDAANPVIMLKHFVDTYGDRKPIMISESGASHTVRTLKNLNENDWAKRRLEILYRFVPMVYPQVKLIAHFDRVMPSEHSDYALSTNSAIEKLYYSLTDDGAFIQGVNDKTSEYTYIKCEDSFTAEANVLEIDAYAYSYGCDDIEVTYYFNGKKIKATDDTPYSVRIDLKKYDAGE
nr:hypothetical protein [Clostridia bacterium]